MVAYTQSLCFLIVALKVCFKMAVFILTNLGKHYLSIYKIHHHTQQNALAYKNDTQKHINYNTYCILAGTDHSSPYNHKLTFAKLSSVNNTFLLQTSQDVRFNMHGYQRKLVHVLLAHTLYTVLYTACMTIKTTLLYLF